jgi:hypothetical protein
MSRRLVLISLMTGLVCFMESALPRAPCDPRRGDTSVKSVQTLNILKTRTNIPTSKNIDSDITISALIKRGNDRDRWDCKMAATVVGYVAKVGVGGIESVNCHAKDAAHRDTYIDLVVSKKDAKNKMGKRKWNAAGKPSSFSKIISSNPGFNLGRQADVQLKLINREQETVWAMPKSSLCCPSRFVSSYCAAQFDIYAQGTAGA